MNASRYECPFPQHFAGHEWVEKMLGERTPEIQMSNLGRVSADILGEVYRGIYHLFSDMRMDIDKVDWGSDLLVVVTVPGQYLATFDFDYLTCLVLLAHDACVRIEIEAQGEHNHMNIKFSPRTGRTGSRFLRHPTIEESLFRHRKAYPAASLLK